MHFPDNLIRPLFGAVWAALFDQGYAQQARGVR